jgi:hypothetical protein
MFRRYMGSSKRLFPGHRVIDRSEGFSGGFGVCDCLLITGGEFLDDTVQPVFDPGKYKQKNEWPDARGIPYRDW